MKSISVYDIEADIIESICEECDTTTAELIEALIAAVSAGEVKISEWL